MRSVPEEALKPAPRPPTADMHLFAAVDARWMRPPNEELTDVVEKVLLEHLNPRERRVLRVWILEGRTLKDAGKTIGVSGQRAKELCARALRKLRHPSALVKLIDFTQHDWWERGIGVPQDPWEQGLVDEALERARSATHVYEKRERERMRAEADARWRATAEKAHAESRWRASREHEALCDVYNKVAIILGHCPESVTTEAAQWYRDAADLLRLHLRQPFLQLDAKLVALFGADTMYAFVARMAIRFSNASRIVHVNVCRAAEWCGGHAVPMRQRDDFGAMSFRRATVPGEGGRDAP